jgi:hypothetical protein
MPIDQLINVATTSASQTCTVGFLRFVSMFTTPGKGVGKG